jgi:hypothetical protein
MACALRKRSALQHTAALGGVRASSQSGRKPEVRRSAAEVRHLKRAVSCIASSASLSAAYKKPLRASKDVWTVETCQRFPLAVLTTPVVQRLGHRDHRRNAGSPHSARPSVSGTLHGMRTGAASRQKIAKASKDILDRRNAPAFAPGPGGRRQTVTGGGAFRSRRCRAPGWHCQPEVQGS